MAGRSTGIWGTACEPSTSDTAPAARAFAAISATGFSVPSTLEMWATPTSFTRPPASTSSSSARSSSPSSDTLR